MRYHFGEFELDVGLYALSRAGRAVRVIPKAFDLLRLLVEQRGRVVTKQELLDTLWADRQVGEGAIAWTISRARRAVGQCRADKGPIETVHGRGYRFVAQVDVKPRVAERPPAPRGARHPQPPRSPFVGREEVMAVFGARLSETKAGTGGLSALVGEGGIGKTRCMHELAALAREHGFAVWSGRSIEDAPVFWPWTQILGALVRERPALHETAVAVLSRVGAIGPVRVAPDLHDDARAGSFWLFDGVSSLLCEAAREGPVLLLLDDLQWTDAGSLQLLSFIAPELARQPVLVLTAQRDERDARRQHELRKLARHAERIPLKPLTPGETHQYLRAVSGSDAPTDELSAALHRATAGNPLLLSQTVRGLIARHGQDALGSLSPRVIATPRRSSRCSRQRCTHGGLRGDAFIEHKKA